MDWLLTKGCTLPHWLQFQFGWCSLIHGSSTWRWLHTHNLLWDGSKGVINFPCIFYAMRSLVPVGHFRNISGHLFAWLVCGSVQWRHGLLFTDCNVWHDKDNVTGFKRLHWIHVGWWSTGSPKLKLFQLLQHSHITNCWLISSSANFPWNRTLKCKMQYLKVPEIKSYILSQGHSVFQREIFFF